LLAAKAKKEATEPALPSPAVLSIKSTVELNQQNMSIPDLTEQENAQEEEEAAMSPLDAEKPQGDVQNSPATVIDDKTGDVAQDGSSAETVEESPRRVFTKKVCGVCNEKESKYKCTRCFLP
jgi:hypothetical protein